MPGGLWRGKHSSHLRVNIKKKKGQEPANATEKDDATNATTAQA